MGIIPNQVIIWGSDNFNTLGLVRQLGKYDIDILFLVNGKAGISAKSKYIKETVETSTVEEGFNYLVQNAKHHSLKPIVIVSSDEVIVYLDNHRNSIENNYILPGTEEQGLTTKYTDKNNMTTLANKMGILCPLSRQVAWNSDISDVRYPCIIKPAHETPGYYNEFKFRICKRKRELEKLLKIVRKNSVFIVQEYIEKEKDLLVYGCRMRNGETVFAGVLIKDRWDDSGSGSYGVISKDIPECINLRAIEEVMGKIRFYGLFSVEYALKDNRAYFYEINFRNDGTSHYFYQAGANLPLAYTYSCAGLQYKQIPTEVIHDGIMIDEILDVENVIHFNISLKKYKEDYKKATIFKYYDKDDQAPWNEMKKSRLKLIAKDMIVKNMRPYIVYIGTKMGLRK